MREIGKDVAQMESGRISFAHRALMPAVAVAMTAMSGFAADARAEVIYRENFTNTTSAGQPMAYAGWNANRGSTGTAQSVDGLIYPNIANGSGDAPLPSVNSNPAEADAVAGYIYNWGQNGDFRYDDYLIWTDEYAIDRGTYEGLTFSTNTNLGGNPTLSDAMRIAVRVGDNWYVSDPAVQPTATSWANSWTDGVVSASEDGSWRSLTFNPGTAPITVGDAAVLPSGDIDAFGVFADAKSTNVRFGAYQVDGTAIPEPASLGLIGLAGLCLARRRARTR